MTDYFSAVKHFNQTFRSVAPLSPTLTPHNDPEKDENLKILKLNLIQEEFNEVKEAFEKNDLVNLAKEIADLLYVTVGAAVAYGIHLDEVFDEVHRSNMSKLDENGQPIFRADGKILKSPLYSEANIAPIIAKQIKGANDE